ncbi:G-type lectin S-receptor-like serine/threonine-protein kinase At4g27290 [Apium graveolens]|uniref:G-type lectin S-receptor-like serine/threonine-protein kinase At4g27290 n=1 Tax=Apium graveolens TaxID=4045 RepID=UPI003D7B3203
MDSQLTCKFALFCTYICVFFCICTSTDTITSTLFISDAKNDTLLSPNGVFKLGFFSPPLSINRYLGIWFNKVHVQNVVWVANRDSPLKSSDGVFKITGEKNIVILPGENQTQQPVWSSNVTEVSVTSGVHAKLLDSGNLVLNSGSGRVIWQSFDHPTDTILPGMKLGVDKRTGLKRVITSWKSLNDPGTGDFTLALDASTVLPQMYGRLYSYPVWRGGPWNGQIMIGLPTASRIKPVEFSVEAALFNYTFVNNKDEVYITFGPDPKVFRRLKVEEAGYAEQQLWNADSKEWNIIWTAPQDRCDKYKRCGAYSLCNNTNSVQCMCLPGYEAEKYQEWDMNCVEKRKKLHSSCGKGQGEGFIKIKGLKVPDVNNARFIKNISLQECELECFKNCNCTGYASADVSVGGRGCFAWYGELIDVRTNAADGQDLYIRVDAQELEENIRKRHGMQKKIKLIIIFLVLSVVALLIIYWWRKRVSKKAQERKKRYLEMILEDSAIDPSNEVSQASSLADKNNLELTFFQLDTILKATDNFSPATKLGQGGFGPVYKGELSNGQEIAVKRLSRNSHQGLSEFKNEALLIAKLQHRNLVRLLGCCIENEEKMLVYEFMPNLSLDCFLFDETRKSLLNWKKRHDIIVGIARGILYLHQDSRLKIIHRDLKTSNILLDKDLNPKISDFGTARLFGGNQSQANTCTVVGTFGYMSPEYILHGLFSDRSDVFSFGVLLLEIISGKKNCGVVPDFDPPSNLISYVWARWTAGKAIDIVDTSIGDACPAHEVLRCIQVGLLCVQDNSPDRPTMSAVVFMLSNDVNLPLPKQPVFAMYRSHNNPDTIIYDTNSSSINELTVTNPVGR